MTGTHHFGWSDIQEFLVVRLALEFWRAVYGRFSLLLFLLLFLYSDMVDVDIRVLYLLFYNAVARPPTLQCLQITIVLKRISVIFLIHIG